jgi:hypothetical protein
MPPLFAQALLLALLFIGGTSVAETRKRTMDATTMLQERMAGLADAVYQRRDAAAVADLPGEAALSGFQGLLIGAPRRVEPGRDAEFHALLLSGRTPTQSQQVPWHDNAILVATDIDRGTVLAGPAFVRPATKSPEPPAAPRPPEPPPQVAPAAPGVPPPPEGSNAGTAWLHVPSLLPLLPHNARLALRVLYFDRVSNAALTQRFVDTTPLSPRSLAEATEIVTRLRAAGQSAHKLPVYRRHAATPVAPEASGVAFTVGPIGPTMPLHAALRVEVSVPMLVRGASSAGPGNEAPPRAVLTATVLMVRRNHTEPHVLPIEFPLWSDKELVAGQTLEAAFSIDLATLLPPSAIEPGAQIYVLAGRHISPPQALRR